MNYQIEEGDEVDIQFDVEGHASLRGIVRHRPCATGDSWIIEAPGGEINYVNMFACMTRRKQKVGP